MMLEKYFQAKIFKDVIKLWQPIDSQGDHFQRCENSNFPKLKFKRDRIDILVDKVLKRDNGLKLRILDDKEVLLLVVEE